MRFLRFCLLVLVAPFALPTLLCLSALGYSCRRKDELEELQRLAEDALVQAVDEGASEHDDKKRLWMQDLFLDQRLDRVQAKAAADAALVEPNEPFVLWAARRKQQRQHA